MSAGGDAFNLLVWLPLLAPGWPLALLVAMAVPAWRGALLRLVPWAALPALLTAVAAPSMELPLPGLLISGSLLLDATGRWLLASVALLWLASGLLARDWLSRPRRATAWLLAMAGALWLPLTGDLASALAASVLAAYPLYGLLGGGRGGRMLLASVVIADLLILEAALLLAKGGVGLAFDTLPMALSQTKAGDLIAVLLLIGFGAKAGLMGLHYWLAPGMEDSQGRQFGITVAFTLAAGLLPLLRVLPPVETPRPAATLLSWLALAGCVWAVVAGVLQKAPRARRAYLLSAVTGLWVVLIERGLEMPVSSADVTAGFAPAVALSGLALAALLLAGEIRCRHQRLSASALVTLAVLLALLALLGAALPTLSGRDGLDWPLLGALACVGILLGAAAILPAASTGRMQEIAEQRAAAVLVAGALCLTVIAILSSPAYLSVATTWSHKDMLVKTAFLLGGLAVGPAAVAVLAPLPRVPAGDLLALIERSSAAVVAAWHRFGAVLGRWVGLIRAAAWSLLDRLARQRIIDDTEVGLRRWATATLLLLAVSAAVALLARPA